MKLLLTGGSGFIGKNLIEAMGETHEIDAPSHSQLELVDDHSVSEFFKHRTYDAVIHAAVRPGHRNAKDASNQMSFNLRMFYNLVRQSKHFGKMIYLGTGLVYDMEHYQPKMKEEYFGKHVPAGDGGYSKYLISKAIEQMNNVIELRLFGVFGKHEDYAIRFISNAICKAIFDLPITIKQNRKFDYLYVDDLPQVIEHFLAKPKLSARVFNVTPDHSMELLALARKVLHASGKKLPIEIAHPGMGLEYSGNNRRLRKEMPKLKLTPIDEAIHKLYRWYHDNQENINRDWLQEDK